MTTNTVVQERARAAYLQVRGQAVKALEQAIEQAWAALHRTMEQARVDRAWAEEQERCTVQASPECPDTAEADMITRVTVSEDFMNSMRVVEALDAVGRPGMREVLMPPEKEGGER